MDKLPDDGPEGRCAVLTVGHSTRPIEGFLELLKAHRVTQLVDVRTVPRSRHNPQFNQDELRASLKRAGIGYAHAPGLGGFRRHAPDSPNAGWRNLSFRGYADYMQTPDFDAELRNLLELARTDRVALMCAEAVPWRCHRSLIADALGAHGIGVVVELLHAHGYRQQQPHARPRAGQLRRVAQAHREIAAQNARLGAVTETIHPGAEGHGIGPMEGIEVLGLGRQRPTWRGNERREPARHCQRCM